MCAEALWIQGIKQLFNSMKTLIIVLEFAMYSLELKIKFKKKLFISDLPTLFFVHNVSGNIAFLAHLS
jgi:hypothetical protein